MSNDMTPFGGDDKITMSTKEIADLCDKEHFHVTRDFEAMCDGLKIDPSKFGGIYIDARNRQQDAYFLPKRETMILVSGYNVELRAKIVDRLAELEAERSKPVARLDDNAWLRSTLLGYTEKTIALEGQIEEMRPQLQAFERIAVSDGSLCITDAAKTLQVQPKTLFAFLRSHRWVYTRAGTSHEVAYQDKLASGLLEHKTTTVTRSDGSEKTVTQVRVTPKGLARLARELPPVAQAA